MTVWTDDENGGEVWSEDEPGRSSLAASSGASLVGFVQSGTGASSRTVQAKLRERVSVEDFGGGVDKSASQNKTAIEAAVAYLSTLGGGEVWFTGGNGDYDCEAFSVTSDNIVLVGNGKSALNFTGNSGAFITFSATSGNSRAECGIIDLPIKKTLNWGTHGSQDDTDSIGVLLQNCRRFKWLGMNVVGFHTGVRLYGLGQGTVYNQFHVLAMRSNKIQVEFLNASNGWTNENSFYGGNWTTTDTGDSETRHLKMTSPSGSGFCDGNNFITCSFEGGPAIGVEIGQNVTNTRFGFTRHEHLGSTPCVDSTGTNIYFAFAQFQASDDDLIVRSGAGRHILESCGTFQYTDENVPSVVYGMSNSSSAQAVKATGSSINLLPDGSAENLVTAPQVSGNSLGDLMPGWEWSYSEFNTGVVTSAETSDKKHGSQSLKIVNTDAQNFRFGFKLTGLDVAAQLTIKFALKCTTIASNAIRVRVGSTLSLNEDLNAPITPDGDWHEYEFKVTPTGADRYFYLYFNTSSAFTAYFDGATITIGDDAPPAYVPSAITERGGQVLGTLKITKASGSSGYLSPFYLGTYALWVDSTGDLRIKSGAPSSDTDGTVVGTQS